MKIFAKGFGIYDIANACGGRYSGKDMAVTGFSTDSGEIFEGAVFVAIKGARRDGADFIPEVLEKGAVCAISATVPAGYEDRVILVDDSVKALGRIASHKRDKMKDLAVVGITGSVGKTTTKEMVYAVLSEKFKTHKTHGNHNSAVGLPMSLMTLDESYKAAVYEMGMSAKGGISALSSIVKPDIAIITNIGNMHIEHLGSREAIRDAKCEITEGLSKKGVLILNGDEPLLAGRENAVYVSLDNPESQVRAVNICEGENGSSFDLAVKGEVIESVVIPTFGKHNILNASMAFLVGMYFGMSEYEIRRGLMSFKSESMRQNFVELGDITFMEDCYNAGPESMKASLGVLEGYCKRKGMRAVAVLGQMRELGAFSDGLHKEVGAFAAQKAELVFAFGSHEIAEGASRSGAIDEKNVVDLGNVSYEEGARVIASKLQPGDCVMFKASRGVELEKLIEEIKGIITKK